MTTLDALRAGHLAGTKRLNLSCGLRAVPPEIYELADTLEVLDLTGNQLSSLPDDFARLHHLKIVFLSRNRFNHLPEVLSECPQLSMVGFKANQIETVSDRALPHRLRWLILTDNRVEQLPDTLGEREQLQKLMLAGNRLRSLPDLSRCHNLELIRLSANQLEALPDWLFHLPRLAWLAYGGNPCCPAVESSASLPDSLPEVDWRALTPGEVLGEGASGTILKGAWRRSADQTPVAIKLFKGQVTSDGLPLEEMRACRAAAGHPHLITALGQVVNHPDGKPGLVLPFIPSDYASLGQPPSLDSCTRDTYPAGTTFTLPQTLRIAASIAAAAAHLQAVGILHGDLYAHNILTNAAGESVLGDFGAASFFEPLSPTGTRLERLEVRAFGYLLEELLDRCRVKAPAHQATLVQLRQLQERCLDAPGHRPRFEAIATRLAEISALRP